MGISVEYVTISVKIPKEISNDYKAIIMTIRQPQGPGSY